MQVTETKSEGLKREIEVVVPASDLEARLQTRLYENKDKVRLKGFRAGKVPMSHMRKMYGRQFMAEIVNQILNETPRSVLSDRGERSATQPEIAMTEDEADRASTPEELWLTAKEQEAWRTFLYATTLLTDRFGEALQSDPEIDLALGEYEILVRLNEAARNDLQQVQNLRVPSAAGQVPLAVVADVSLSAGPTQIERYDRRYRTSVSANLADGAVLGPAAAQVQALQDSLDLPPGTEFQSSGDAEIMAEVFSSFALAMAAGVLLVYVVLVLLFHSFITPISILLSLPLAIGGAILALYIFDFAIGMPVVIGFLMLMGIVTKNAIMLVEFALQAMSDGVPKRDAILDAVHKRARPIIMTTIAMAAGMLPSALSQGDGSEFRSPMAVAVIGGLLLSTLLSLLFVPSLFSLLDGMQDRLGRVLRQLIGVNSERKAPAE